MKKSKVEIKSILEEVAKRGKYETDINKTKEDIYKTVNDSHIDTEDKRKIIKDVSQCNTFVDLTKYLYNSILKYEGYGVIKESINKGVCKVCMIVE